MYNQFISPFTYFNNPANSKPIGLGLLYIGEPDKDPQDFPVQAYVVQPDGSELPISQPITLSAGGVPIYNGYPVQLKYSTELVSVKVTTSAGALIYYTARTSSFVSVSDLASSSSGILIAGVPASELVEKLNRDFVYLEDFNVLSGMGGDDTAAWVAACAESSATGKGVQFLNKTYLITPREASEGNYTFKNFLRGMGDTLIKSFTSPVRIPTGGGNYTWQRVLPLTVNDVTISDFRVDGNISADPLNWATGYDAFTGSRGLVLEGSNRTTVRNVRTQNTMWAGIAHYNCDESIIENCHVDRCRGNFGDGFYMWGRNAQYTCCTAYDVTRIGFVTETNAGSTYVSRNIKYDVCRAEYGHDNSGLYGGVEGNYGFWFENCVQITATNCDSVNMLTGGYNTVPSYISGTEASVADIRYGVFLLQNCNADNSRYGVVINSLKEDLDNRTIIEGGSYINLNTPFYVGTNASFVPKHDVHIKGVDVRISVHNIATRAIMQLAGNVYVDNMEVIFDDGFDQAAWDAGADINGYSTFGGFGTDSGFIFDANNVRCFKEIAGVKTDIGVRTKFESVNTRDNLDVRLSNSNISQVSNVVKSMDYNNCNFILFGSDVVRDTLLYEDCTFTARRQFGSAQVSITYESVEDILFKNCKFMFNTANDYLYIFNQARVTTAPLARLHGCRFIRDFATHGRVIRFDGDPDFKNANNNVFNLEIQDCTFENTGGTTSNAILESGFAEVDAAKVYGRGNYKSATLTVDTTGPIYSTF